MGGLAYTNGGFTAFNPVSLMFTRQKCFGIQGFDAIPLDKGKKNGAPGGIRTHDPCLRRAVLYPAELRMRCGAQSYASALRASMRAIDQRAF